MKTFDYTCRDAKGSIRRGRLEAPDRAGAVRALKARGLAAVSLSEGGGSGRMSPRARSGAGMWARTLVCTGVVLLALAMVWFVIPRGHSTTAVPSKGGGGLKPPPHGTGVSMSTSLSPPSLSADPPVPDPPVEGGGGSGTTPPVMTVGGEGTAEEWKGIPVEAPRMPAPYQSRTEGLLSMLVNITPGTYPPPIPNFPSVEDLAQVLDRDIIVFDHDSDQMLGRKENVARVKQSLKEYLQAGGTAQEFVEYYRGELLKDYEDFRVAQAEMMRLFRAGEDDELEMFLTEQNNAFQERGMRLLVRPPRK
ncbi:MAG: hypothetical protein FWH21_04520 [Kiritimatiellaeota bacterium]|nr:hypothetical protein [Kiritimatiellota bacterium]